MGVGKLRLAQLSELKPARGVRDRRQSLWRLLEHSPQFACAGLIIYTDVSEEVVKTRGYVGSATTEARLRCPTNADQDVWEWVWE